eukprot:gene2619-3011_t
MFKSIIALLFIIAAASAININFNGQDIHLKSNPSPSEFGDFMLGFLEGLEITFSPTNNMTQCVVASNTSFEEFDNGFALIGSGFKHISIKDFDDGCKEVGQGLAQIPKIMTACGVTELTDDIFAIAAKLASGTDGIIEYILKEALDILYHKTDLTEDFKSMVSNWESNNYMQSGISFGEIVGILIEN